MNGNYIAAMWLALTGDKNDNGEEQFHRDVFMFLVTVAQAAMYCNDFRMVLRRDDITGINDVTDRELVIYSIVQNHGIATRMNTPKEEPKQEARLITNGFRSGRGLMVVGDTRH